MISTLRSIYAWGLFGLILVPVFILAQLEAAAHSLRGTPRDGLRRRVARGLSRYARWSPLYDFRIEGREHLPTSGPYVLVSNHESLLDPLCFFLLETPARILASDRALRVPFVATLFRSCEHIGVNRSDADSRKRALDTACLALEDGTPVAIFPEGQLPSAPGEMAEFHTGAFVAAQSCGVPVVPVVLSGTGRAWAPDTVVVEGRHAIGIRVLAPLEPGDGDPEDLARTVRSLMARPA